jgi:hypothetical protein
MDGRAHLDLWNVRALETPRVPINADGLSSEAAIIRSSRRADGGVLLWCVRSVDRCSQQLVLDASEPWFVGSLAGGSIHRWLLDVESAQGRRHGSVYDVSVPARVRVDDCQSIRRHAHRTGTNTPLRHVEPTEFQSARSRIRKSRAMVRVGNSCRSGVRLAWLPLAHFSLLGVRTTGFSSVGIGTSGTMDHEPDWCR